MFHIDGGNIYIHRGDSASFDIVFGKIAPEELGENQISVEQLYGTDLIPDNGTHIRFSVKVNTEKYRCVIQKDYEVTNGICTFNLLSKDTRYLPSQEYKWGIRLLFENEDITEENTPLNPFSFYVIETVPNSD